MGEGNCALPSVGSATLVLKKKKKCSNLMQKLLIIPALLVGAFFVSGCGDDGEFGDDDMSADNPRYVLVDTPEGPESCILAPGTGISCDWSTP